MSAVPAQAEATPRLEAGRPPDAPPAGDPAAHLARGQALIGRGEPGAAVIVLREAIRLRPDLVEARASLGRALQAIGDLDSAIEEFRAVLRVEPDVAAVRLSLATALMAQRDWAGARTKLEEALEQQPDLLEAHYSLGLVRYTLGDLSGAIEAYRRVLQLEPRHVDARYHLALALRLAGRDDEATREFLAAAEQGLPRAQYFAGAAYATGIGVNRSLAAAIEWLFRAADGGVQQAEEALAQLRQVALGKGRSAPAERLAAERAFRDYRAALWGRFPGLPRGEDDSPGAALLRHGRVVEAIPLLIREASALGDSAQRLLESLYEAGVEGRVLPHDPRILAYLVAAAAEGLPRPRIELARIYARGLGVPKDLGRAMALLRTTPHEDAQRLLHELSGASDEGQ